MKLKFLFLTLTSIVILLSSKFSFGNDVPLMINEQVVRNEEIILAVDGVSYGQLSDWASRFNAVMSWDEQTKQIILYREGSVYAFSLESDQVLVNGEAHQMTASTFTHNGKLYVPLYYLSEVLSFGYRWDMTFNLLSVVSEHEIVEPNEVVNLGIQYSEEDVLWLARIIDAEAGAGSLTHKTAVGNVVLNRVKSSNFANTIYDVIFQPGQFTPTNRSDFRTRVPRESSIVAARRALMGIVVAENCLYFNNRPFRWKNPKDLYMVMEGQYFYR